MRRLLHRATFCLLTGLSCALCACSSQSPGSSASAATGGGSGSAVGCHASDGDAYAPGLQKAGTMGHFDFTLLSSTPAPPALDDNQFVLQVSDESGAALDGQLSVTLDMPQHGHPSPTQPDISFDEASRAFTLEPMNLFMVGLWRIKFAFQAAVKGEPLTDSAEFEFCID